MYVCEWQSLNYVRHFKIHKKIPLYIGTKHFNISNSQLNTAIIFLLSIFWQQNDTKRAGKKYSVARRSESLTRDSKSIQRKKRLSLNVYSHGITDFSPLILLWHENTIAIQGSFINKVLKITGLQSNLQSVHNYTKSYDVKECLLKFFWLNLI